MLFFMRNSYLTIILISLCVQTYSFRHNIIPEDLEMVLKKGDYQPGTLFALDMDKCMAVMRKYCNVRPTPTAADCVRQAILTWHKDDIPDGILKNYFLSFAEYPENLKSISVYMMNPKAYCGLKPSHEIASCKAALEKFEGTKEEALTFALYDTKIERYCDVVEENGTKIIQITNQIVYDYMLFTRSLVVVEPTLSTMSEPLDYCYLTVSNANNKESEPLDWTPYLPEDEN